MKDANANVVGTLIGQDVVVLKVNNQAIATYFDYSGFQSYDSCNFQFWHTTPDCSGTRYQDASGGPPIDYSNNNTLYYAATPIQTLTITSVETFSCGGVNMSLPGTCHNSSVVTPFPAIVGAVQTFDLNSLSLTPRFTVSFP